MFSRFSRLPLRRCLHTGPTSASASSFSSSRAKAVIGASAVLTAYMTWQLTNDRNKISLDAPSTPKPEAPRAKSIPKESRTSEPITRDDLARKPESIQLDDDFVPDKPEEPALSTGGETSTEGESSEEGEGQASAGGAFNPETGEINWDCPCLGGMAHGPCGPEFREAFSCFVYSEAEPKGINCVEKFQNMQNCFRAHPEVYADEIMDDDEEEVPAGSDASNFPPSEGSDDNLNDTTTPGAQKPQIEKNTPIATDSPL